MNQTELNAALAEFHARTNHAYDRVTDLTAIKDLADLRGWHWIALAITRWELELAAQACQVRWDKIELLPASNMRIESQNHETEETKTASARRR